MSTHIQHHQTIINGIRTHYAEQGTPSADKPTVILAHGFPHTWFSWHRQMQALADAGYHVVAPDLRGMGKTEAPHQPQAYDVPSTYGDLLGLLDHLGLEKAVFMGLDFGLFAIYDLAYHQPERMHAIIGLENPAWPHNPELPPLKEAAQWAENHFVHIQFFEAFGPADIDLNSDPKAFIRKVYYALSGDYHYLDVWKHPNTATYMEALPETPPLPWNWITEEEVDTIAADYAANGFTGGLNWYRAMDIRWQQRKPFEGKPNTVPFYFIGSENDVDLEAWHGEDPLAQLKQQYTDLRAVKMLKHAGHMMHLEKTDEVNAVMLEFMADICGKF